MYKYLFIHVIFKNHPCFITLSFHFIKYFPFFSVGNNILFCAVYGPKGPVDEVFVKHLGRNMYQVNYTAKEKGDHIVIVKWGEDHIPGSPFKVEVSS